MPTIPGIPGPYRFYFYSVDCEEPPHVHVERETARCKFWLRPVVLARGGRFGPHELAGIERTIIQYLTVLLEAWDDYCGT